VDGCGRGGCEEGGGGWIRRENGRGKRKGKKRNRNERKEKK
jgi:hypothetical protein